MDGGHLGGRPRVCGGEALGAMKAEVRRWTVRGPICSVKCVKETEKALEKTRYRVGPAKELWHHGGWNMRGSLTREKEEEEEPHPPLDWILWIGQECAALWEQTQRGRQAGGRAEWGGESRWKAATSSMWSVRRWKGWPSRCLEFRVKGQRARGAVIAKGPLDEFLHRFWGHQLLYLLSCSGFFRYSSLKTHTVLQIYLQ